MNDLIQFATVRQIEILESIIETGSQQKAAKKLGIGRTTVRDAVNRVKKKAALQDPKQHDYTKIVPEGFTIKGVSQYIDKDGNFAGQWIKTNADHEKLMEIAKAQIEAMCEDIPKSGTIILKSGTLDHLINVYTITDAHVGALAWDVETKSGDWDLAIAESTLSGCMKMMIEQAPKAHTCVIANLGDYCHYDSSVAPVTPIHGNVLDADGRMPKMVKVAIRTLRTMIKAALSKHEKVVLLIAEGNHDPASSIWLRAMFQALYENEPRIEVVDSELPYYTYKHGNTMLAWHHGHLTKNAQLPILFASQFPKVWGDTTKRYCHTGHKHHCEEKEHSGMTVTQHPTLAARDAYAARGGWIAERQATAITYSSKYGKVGTVVITPEMIE
jgi:hypothetical protein